MGVIEATLRENTSMPTIRMSCPECSSTHITKDAMAEWDETTQQWVLCAVYDCETCQDCEAERDGLALRVEINPADAQVMLTSGYAEDDQYPPPCPGRGAHSWIVSDDTGAATCEYCLADGDA